MLKDRYITFHPLKQTYIVKIGARVVGEYASEDEAIKAYNDTASKMFSFPVLIKPRKPEDENYDDTEINKEQTEEDNGLSEGN